EFLFIYEQACAAAKWENNQSGAIGVNTYDANRFDSKLLALRKNKEDQILGEFKSFCKSEWEKKFDEWTQKLRSKDWEETERDKIIYYELVQRHLRTRT